MVNWTFGAGGTYADLDAAWVALVAVGAFADNYTLTHVGNCTEAAWTGGNVNLNGYTLRITSNSSHNGNPTSARVLSVNPGVSLEMRVNSAGVFQIDNIYFRMTGPNLASDQFVFPRAFGGILAVSLRLYNLLIEGGGTGGNDVTGLQFGSGQETSEGYCINTKIWNCRYGIQTVDSTANQYIENLSIDTTSYGIYNLFDSELFIFRNCVSTRATYRSYLEGGVGTVRAQYFNCADDDGFLPSHSGVVHNIVPANEFQSLVDTNANYLNLFTGEANQAGFTTNRQRGAAPLEVQFTSSIQYDPVAEQLAKTGVAPTYATRDIAGRGRPGADGAYSIGAHEAQYTES